MTVFPGRSAPVLRRLVGVLLAFGLLSAVVPAAATITEEEVDEAEQAVERLQAEIEGERGQLAAMQARANELATEFASAQFELDATLQALVVIRERRKSATERYERLRRRLDARAAEAFMNGPGSGLEFLLGSASLNELSDRLEFIDAAAQTDAELATEVDNLRNQLADDEAELERLRERQVNIVASKREARSELASSMRAQQDLVASIQAKEAEAGEYAKKLGREYKEQQAALLGGPVDGVFKYCPVDPPRGVSNSFGAPRFAGGYHLHAGVDIFAPTGTPIRAPFDGVAQRSDNGLGGIAVKVFGQSGYVYNAHLSAVGQLGQVSAGAIVGYVGNTGDALGTSPHDHFEWHPTAIPSDWQASPYGYSVIGDAVNPYPILIAACV